MRQKKDNSSIAFSDDKSVYCEVFGFDLIGFYKDNISRDHFFTVCINWTVSHLIDSGMIEVMLNDRLGKKVRVKCNEDDTIGDLKKLAAAQLGTRPEKLKIQKWYTVYKGEWNMIKYRGIVTLVYNSTDFYGVFFF